MTNSQRMRLSAVAISSTMPSAKYSCSGSPLRFWNGNTAIDGLSGNASGADTAGFAPSLMRQTCTGLAMFLTCCSPRSSNATSSLSRHLVVHHSADADAARLRQRFETCRDVDAISIDVVLVDDHVTEVDAYAE